MNADIRELLKAGVQDIFMDSYAKYLAETQYRKVASVIESGKESESYAWLSDAPSVREFVGERDIKSIGEEHFYLANKTWEATIGVKRETIDDDQYGQLKIRIADLAYEAACHKDKLVFDMLTNGRNIPCYDGKSLFATNHTYTGKGAYRSGQSNLGTAELGKESLQDAISGMMNLKRSNGEPGGVIPDCLIVPPALAWTAKELVNSVYNPSATGAAGAANPLQGTLEIIVTPYLTGQANWFVACTKRPVKPVILQERQGVEFEALEGASQNGFMRNEYTYGISARYNAGPGLWQYIYGSFPS